RQDGDADHAFGRGGDLPRVAHRRHERATDAHPRADRDPVRVSALGIVARNARVQRVALAYPRARDEGIRRSGAAVGTGARLTRGGDAMKVNRRQFLQALAVDGQIWTGIDRGAFAKHNVELDLVQFTTGLELFQAMIGGSIEMLATGAVISNFPARGQGRMFLVNDVEFATAQLWVRGDIRSFADLKGKKISTTTGTTAHVFLDTALRANGVDPKDVEVVNQRMSEAVTSFISGAVPAVALWVPFNVPVREKVPDAKMLADASAYYPKAAIVGGWAAREDYFDK